MNNQNKKMISVQMELPESYDDAEIIFELKKVIDELRALSECMRRPLSYSEEQLAENFGISKKTLEKIRRGG